MKVIILIINFVLLFSIQNTESSVCIFKNIITNNTKSVADINSNITTDCAIKGKDVNIDSINKLCTIILQNDTATIPLSLLTIRNEIPTIDKSYYNICRNGQTGIFSWIHWNVHQAHIKSGLELAEGHWFVGRNLIDNQTDKYEFCTIDLTTGICRSLEFKDQITLTTFDTEILIEKLPIRYELRNVQYSAWKNISGFMNVVLNETTLNNYNSETQYIEHEIEYDYKIQRIIEFPKYFVKSAQVDLYENDEIKTTTIMYVGKSYEQINLRHVSVAKKISGKSSVVALIEGTWMKTLTEITANLIIIYDEGNNNITANDDQIINFKSTNIETSLADIIISFGNETEIELISKTTSKNFQEIISSQQIDNRPEQITPAGIYPNFKTFSIIACIIVSSVILIAVIDILRRTKKDKMLRERRRIHINDFGMHELN